MYCPSCGMEIDDNSRFCSTCGEKITDVLNDLGIRYKGGDQSAFQEIYDDTVSWVRSYVYNRVSSNNVEDCLQSVYIKLFENISKFDETKGPFRAWFNTLVANETIDFLRKYEKPQSKNVDSLYDEEDKVIDIVDPGMSPEDVMEKQEVAQIMSEILAEISEDQRQCIMLRYMEGLKNKEIADIMGISEGTVKSRISYGLKRVEAKVIALEKQGTKLYSMAPLPFFIWIICRGNVAGLTISGNLWSNIAASTFGMSANAVAGVAVTAGGANAMAGMGTAMNAGIAAETGAVAGAEAMTGAEALSGAGMSISSGISAEVGTVAGSEAMMGAGTSISAGISVETGAAGTGAVAEVSTGASAGAVAEVSTGSTAAAGGSATASAGATAGTGVSASGATTVTGGMTKAGAGVVAGATGLAAMGLKGLLIKIFLGITIAAAAVGGGFGIKHLVEKAKKIESESESSIGKPTTEEVATATDADAVVIGDATATDVVVAEYPEWIDKYMETVMEETSDVNHMLGGVELFDIDSDGIPEIELYPASTGAGTGMAGLYVLSGDQVLCTDFRGQNNSLATYISESNQKGIIETLWLDSDAPCEFVIFEKKGDTIVENYRVWFGDYKFVGIVGEYDSSAMKCYKIEYINGNREKTEISYDEAKTLVSDFIYVDSFEAVESDSGAYYKELEYTVNEGMIIPDFYNFEYGQEIDYEDLRQWMHDYYISTQDEKESVDNSGADQEAKSDIPVEYQPLMEEFYNTLLSDEILFSYSDEGGIDLGYSEDRCKDFGYCFMDIDSNGVLELLITKSGYLYIVYTLDQGEPVCVTNSWHRGARTLLEGGIIYCYDNLGGVGIQSYYTIEPQNGSWTVADYYFNDRVYESEDPLSDYVIKYYYQPDPSAVDDNRDVSTAIEISEEELQEFLDACKAVEYETVSFDEYVK